MFIINQITDVHTDKTRLSKLWLPTVAEQFCWVLEDCERGSGIKIRRQTALPKGIYHVTITYSNRFGRETLQLYTHEADLTCRHGGILFTGVRVHGGNTHEDTEGCPLVAYNRSGDDRIYQRADLDLFDWLKPIIDNHTPVLWIIN